jgi:hypothetical protein
MSQTTKRTSKPVAPDEPLALIARIRAAHRLAIEILARGFSNENAQLEDALKAFAGHDDAIEVPDGEYPRIENWILQAFAVGVAVGQRLDVRAFETGGAR